MEPLCCFISLLGCEHAVLLQITLSPLPPPRKVITLRVYFGVRPCHLLWRNFSLETKLDELYLKMLVCSASIWLYVQKEDRDYLFTLDTLYVLYNAIITNRSPRTAYSQYYADTYVRAVHSHLQPHPRNNYVTRD